MTGVVPHDWYSTNVGEVVQQYSLERATNAVGLLLDVVLDPAIRHPSDALTEWSAKFTKTFESLGHMRAEGTDF